MIDEPDYRRGIVAARSNLWVARLAASRYLSQHSKGREADKYDLMLNCGAFFLFARAALEALEKSDGKASPPLADLQREYFQRHIKDHPVFALLKGERDRVAHGDDSWAFHPMMPLRMIDRFASAGHDWTVAVFDAVWPDGYFQGQSLEAVLNQVWRQISNWLDDIDVLDAQQNGAR